MWLVVYQRWGEAYGVPSQRKDFCQQFNNSINIVAMAGPHRGLTGAGVVPLGNELPVIKVVIAYHHLV